jgi:hypothetical protein
MVPSKRSQDTIALGKRIVSELGLTDSCETLAKWMAHYLAEQIQLAEAEQDPLLKQQIEQRCSELVLRLWKKRHSMPGRVAPLANLRDALTALQEMHSERTSLDGMRQLAQEGHSPWFEFACKSYSIDRRMSAIAYLTGVLEADIGVARQWVVEHKDMLSSDEKKLIETLDDWLNNEMRWDIDGSAVSIGTLQPKERTNAVLCRLEEVLQQQVDALQHLKMRLSVLKPEPTELPTL